MLCVLLAFLPDVAAADLQGKVITSGLAKVMVLRVLLRPFVWSCCKYLIDC